MPPSITLYSAGLSDTVGGPFGSFADAFTDAMAPWQAGNYVEAAMRLDVLAASFPAVAEAHFYQGAAWLLAGVPADAVAPLRRSVALAPAAMHPDATWYLGLALVEADEVADGMQVFIAGCAAGGRSACRAVEYLRGVQPMPVVLAPPVSWPAHSAREYDGA